MPELNADRKLEPLRLREMRKRLENDEQHTLEDIESVALECMDEIVELCSGKYIYMNLMTMTSFDLLNAINCRLHRQHCHPKTV